MDRRSALVLALLVLPGWAGAEVEAPVEPTAPSRAMHWYAFVAPFYLPETRIGLGATAGAHRPLCDGCQPSSLHLEAAYTQNAQFSISLVPRVFASPSFAVSANVRYANFPDRFFGVGPRSPPGGEAYTPRIFELLLTPEFYVLGKLRVGPKLHLRREEIVGHEPGGLLASGAVHGVSGSFVMGLGASATWDTRDSQFFPRSGTNVEVWYLHYPAVLGQPRDFGRAAVDASWFVPLGGDHVLALDASLAGTEGVAPFTMLANVGGVHTLRGYRDGRYRDQLSYGIQVEYRFPIVWRLRGVAFGGVGDVAPSMGSFGIATARAAGGAGLRFRLTDDGVHLRLDAASTGGEPDLYMIVLEAF
jgi:hypothetical protein